MENLGERGALDAGERADLGAPVGTGWVRERAAVSV
jgi:hypothetical protein